MRKVQACFCLFWSTNLLFLGHNNKNISIAENTEEK